MGVVLAVLGNNWSSKYSATLQRFKKVIIILPDLHSIGRNHLGLLKLSPEKCRNDFTWQVGRSDILPSIFIHLSAEKTAAIRSFLANNFSPRRERRIVDE